MLALNKHREVIDNTNEDYSISILEEDELLAVGVMEAINAELDTLEDRGVPPLVLADYMIDMGSTNLDQALENYKGCSEHPGQWALDQFGDQVPGFIRDQVEWFLVAKELVRTFKVWEIEQHGIGYYFKVDEYE